MAIIPANLLSDISVTHESGKILTITSETTLHVVSLQHGQALVRTFDGKINNQPFSHAEYFSVPRSLLIIKPWQLNWKEDSLEIKMFFEVLPINNANNIH